MAQSGTGDILKFGLLAVGGYLLYNWWTSSQAVAAANPPTAPVTPVPLPVASSPAASSGVPSIPVSPTPLPPVTLPGPSLQPLSAALQSAAGAGSTTLNADQWSYYFTSLNGAALSPAQFSAAFPGLTATNRGSYTAQQFVAALAGAGLTAPAGYGLNGLGQVRPRRIIRVPAMVRPAYRRFA